MAEIWNDRFEEDYYLETEVPNISTNTSAGYVVAPHDGYVTNIWSTISGAITVGNAELTVSIGGTDLRDGVITIAYSGSAAGTVDQCTPTGDNKVLAGQAIKIMSNGGSTDAALARLTIEIKKNLP